MPAFYGFVDSHLAVADLGIPAIAPGTVLEIPAQKTHDAAVAGDQDIFILALALLEVPQEEIAPVRELLVREMENVITLSVPLTVECNDGKTWLEAH